MPRAKITSAAYGQEIALLISPVEEDHAILKALFQHNGWTLHVTSSLSSACALLREEATSVVITERDLPDGDWKDVLVAIHILRKPPLLIVISRLADGYLWAEALNLGAYDVLAKPLDQAEAVRVLTSAWVRRASAIRSGHPRRVNRNCRVKPAKYERRLRLVQAPPQRRAPAWIVLPSSGFAQRRQFGCWPSPITVLRRMLALARAMPTPLKPTAVHSKSNRCLNGGTCEFREFGEFDSGHKDSTIRFRLGAEINSQNSQTNTRPPPPLREANAVVAEAPAI
jgi:CheY-like chemotaxis protein